MPFFCLVVMVRCALCRSVWRLVCVVAWVLFVCIGLVFIVGCSFRAARCLSIVGWWLVFVYCCWLVFVGWC